MVVSPLRVMSHPPVGVCKCLQMSARILKFDFGALGRSTPKILLRRGGMRPVSYDKDGLFKSSSRTRRLLKDLSSFKFPLSSLGLLRCGVASCPSSKPTISMTHRRQDYELWSSSNSYVLADAAVATSSTVKMEEFKFPKGPSSCSPRRSFTRLRVSSSPHPIVHGRPCSIVDAPIQTILWLRIPRYLQAGGGSCS